MNSRDIQNVPLAQPLTPREEEILTLIGQGKTNRQIAEELTVARSTVKWYVRQIYNKLSVNNREEAIGRARELGLIVGEDGAVRHNLPVAATPFVGREAELAALAGFIADPHARLVTITGPGGIGKTRLALEAAGREIGSQSQFPDGVFFVSLAPLESAEEITAALATALDFQFQDSGNEPEQLLNYLRNKQMLLVMDNFEHILDGRALLAKINEQAAGITLLVTSRARLQMRGEQVFPLGGLETTQDGEALGETPASELFLHIARRAVPDFQLLEGDDEHLLRICRLVEGMPLGLELAASWAGLLPLSEIAAELEQSLDLLASEHHDVPPWHQSMEAALDLSWRRLTAEQQRTFQELTVFRGGFTRTAALEVASASLPLLITLIYKSWLTYDRQNDRYHIHELLRQYGAARLSNDPTHEQETREKHSAYFCGFLQERGADWYGPRQQEAAAEIGDEIDNIQTAWRWAANKGNGTLLARGMNGLCRFYHRFGRLKDARQACNAAAKGLSKTITAQQDEDAQALSVWALALAWESMFIEEIAQREALLALSQEKLDRASQAGWDTRAEQAFIYLYTAHAVGNKDWAAAVQALTLAAALFKELGERWGEAEALRVMGANELFLGHFSRTHELFSESLKIWQELEHQLGIAETTTNLASLATYQGSYEEAEALHRQGLRLYRLLKNRFYEGMVLTNLSFTHALAGNFPQAREAAAQAWAVERDLGLDIQLWTLISLATAALHLGRFAEAKTEAAQALAITGQRGHLTERGFALMQLGDIALIEGDLPAAREHLIESASLLTELRYVYQGLSRASLCFVLRAQGNNQSARDHLTRALHSGIEFGSMTPIIYCLPVAALLAADEGRTERAVELYSAAQQFGHIKNSKWFADVACNELDDVRASLPTEKAVAAETRGRELDVWETAEALLRELDGR